MSPESSSRPNRNSGDARLDAMFQAYRAACEPREASANFMPELWDKIEKAQRATFSFRRIARGFVTAAAALSFALAAISFLPLQPSSPVYSLSYVDALAAHNEALDAGTSNEGIEYVQDMLHPDSLEDSSAEI